ncbi:CotS family spore coat protein [Bacillus rubiinfantis]|uniref:CotS family spore coat protein n=1 Tax=Bacillus rubiinfantis TaxID=1499680 RepID=UPI0005A5D09A|nr:CotS family spore coat protein [Bacillus rubiinfantis]
MNNQVIIPWDVDEQQHEFFIPDYIHEMALQVLKAYDFSVKNMEVVTTKPDKGGAIWKLETNAGPKSLKLLHRRPSRSLFSLGAQKYLVEVQKASVPPIIPTKTGEDYVVAGGKCWFVAQWIEPLFPVSKDLEGAKQLCAALGKFHHLSKGYKAPAQAEVSSRLHKWPANYQKIIEKMDWFRNIAAAYSEMPASKPLLEVVGQFETQAIQASERLNQSSYNRLAAQGPQYWGLVHQDYGWSNGQMGQNEMWIIDLDGVSYDLPIRDLRKLITGSMADLGGWDTNWVREMLKAYHGENPISPELYELLLIDFSLPDQFYKNIKEVVYEPELFLTEETVALIQTIVEVDKTKWPVLEEIKDDWKGEN